MPRMLHSTPCRFLALVLAVVLVLTFATPAKAEAFDVLTGLAIAGAAIIVLVLVVYLVVANVEGSKLSHKLDGPRVVQQSEVVWVVAAVRESP
jgi:hypothetical protein